MQQPLNDKDRKLYQEFLKETGQEAEKSLKNLDPENLHRFEQWLKRQKASLKIHYQPQIEVNYRRPLNRQILPMPPFIYSLEGRLRALRASFLVSFVCLLALCLIWFFLSHQPAPPPSQTKAILSFLQDPQEKLPEKIPDPPDPLQNLMTAQESSAEDLQLIEIPASAPNLKNVDKEIESLEEVAPIQFTDSSLPTIPPVETTPSVAPETSALENQSELPSPSQASSSNKLAHRFNAQTRQELLRQHGGSPQIEHAVNHALQWLADHQEANGSWSPGSLKDTCRQQGHRPCDVNAIHNLIFDEAITSLALLAFLGGGHSSSTGNHKKAVSQTLSWLTTQQNPDGSFGSQQGAQGYATGVAALALLEAQDIDPQPKLLPLITSAILWLVKHQVKKGGWDYNPGTTRADVSITSWGFLALLRSLELGIPDGHMAMLNALSFIRNQMRKDGRVIYESHPFSGSTLGSTAAGLLAEQYRWNSRRHLWRDRLTKYILAHPPQRADPQSNSNTHYYWYTASLALFHQGGDAWLEWWNKMEPFLLAQQVPLGRQKGSFPPQYHGMGTSLSNSGGRILSTIFTTLTLECLWRYLPLYQKHSRITSPAKPSAQDALPINQEKILFEKTASPHRLVKTLGDLYKQNISQETQEKIQGFLNSKNTSLKLEAARFLARRKDPEAIPVLIDFIQKYPHETRSRAAANWLVEGYPNNSQVVQAVWQLTIRQKNPLVTQRLLGTLRQTQNSSIALNMVQWAEQQPEGDLKDMAFKVAKELLNQDVEDY